MSTDQLLTSVADLLPADGDAGTIVGRVWRPELGGPSPVVVRDGFVVDISRSFATVSDLCETENPVAELASVDGEQLGSIERLAANTPHRERDPSLPWLLAPVDLQPVKAAGVTFAASMIERLIEERAGGNAGRADDVRRIIRDQVGSEISAIVPGSDRARALAEVLKDQGLWSQYLEVGIGPDAEIFTKAPTLSAVGGLADVGVLRTSKWSNPEPEVAVVVSSTGRIVGASLGNDVNLRDYEGRSALLLGKAKDNNASCALGPFVRLFDSTFSLEDVRIMKIALEVDGPDGFELRDYSHMSLISRHPLELVSQLMGPNHQYPDGVVLLLGTMFAPTADRGEPGLGFTHHTGDIVRISCDALGTLANRVLPSDECTPWTFGIAALMRNLSKRGLL